MVICKLTHTSLFISTSAGDHFSHRISSAKKGYLTKVTSKLNSKIWNSEHPIRYTWHLAFWIEVPDSEMLLLWNLSSSRFYGRGIGFTRFLLYTSNKTRPLKVSNAKRGHCSSHPYPVGETLIRWNEWRSRKNFFLYLLTFLLFLKAHIMQLSRQW